MHTTIVVLLLSALAEPARSARHSSHLNLASSSGPLKEKFCTSEPATLDCGDGTIISTIAAAYISQRSTSCKAAKTSLESCDKNAKDLVAEKCDGERHCTLLEEAHRTCSNRDFTFIRVVWECEPGSPPSSDKITVPVLGEVATTTGESSDNKLFIIPAAEVPTTTGEISDNKILMIPAAEVATTTGGSEDENLRVVEPHTTTTTEGEVSIVAVPTSTEEDKNLKVIEPHTTSGEAPTTTQETLKVAEVPTTTQNQNAVGESDKGAEVVEVHTTTPSQNAAGGSDIKISKVAETTTQSPKVAEVFTTTQGDDRILEAPEVSTTTQGDNRILEAPEVSTTTQGDNRILAVPEVTTTQGQNAPGDSDKEITKVEVGEVPTTSQSQTPVAGDDEILRVAEAPTTTQDQNPAAKEQLPQTIIRKKQNLVVLKPTTTTTMTTTTTTRKAPDFNRCYRFTRSGLLVRGRVFHHLTTCPSGQGCFKVVFPDGKDYTDPDSPPSQTRLHTATYSMGSDSHWITWNGIGVQRNEFWTWGVCLPKISKNVALQEFYRIKNR